MCTYLLYIVLTWFSPYKAFRVRQVGRPSAHLTRRVTVKSAEADVGSVDTSTQVSQVGRRPTSAVGWLDGGIWFITGESSGPTSDVGVGWLDGTVLFLWDCQVSRRRRRMTWWYYVILMGRSSEPTLTSAVGWLDGTMLFLWDRQVSRRPASDFSRFKKNIPDK